MRLKPVIKREKDLVSGILANKDIEMAETIY
jgi:hypothetical protein